MLVINCVLINFTTVLNNFEAIEQSRRDIQQSNAISSTCRNIIVNMYDAHGCLDIELLDLSKL